MSMSANPNYGVVAVAGSGGVTLSGGNAYDFDPGSPALAGFEFGSDGDVDKILSWTTVPQHTDTDWIRPDTLAPGTYYIRITNVNWISIQETWNRIDSPEDIWIDLTANRQWSVADGQPFPTGYKNVSFDVEIRHGVAGPTVATGSYSLEADYESGVCFGPDTIVLMEDDSEKLMKDLEVDDVLKAYSVPNRIDESDPNWTDWEEPEVDSGTVTTSKVITLDSYPRARYYLINNELKVTGAHHLLVYRDSVANWMWVQPADITVGDTLYNVDKVVVPITSIELVRDSLITYNINVEEIDTFYVKVGDEFIVAHNKIAL